MFEYRVIEARNHVEAEELMNKMANDGWRVVEVVFWTNFKTCLIITLEREKKG
ncbi:MAG: DUF4177 domain-containing protein [Clostridia bacterium]|nr:DUF4177 domain-containing protein [Clostridia bacterium]